MDLMPGKRCGYRKSPTQIPVSVMPFPEKSFPGKKGAEDANGCPHFPSAKSAYRAPEKKPRKTMC
jgi:hypothetical protein